jgi:hypothetical protein
MFISVSVRCAFVATRPICRLCFDSRLIDVLFREMQLYLVFEFMECDLKRYMEASVDRPECKLGEPLIRVGLGGIPFGVCARLDLFLLMPELRLSAAAGPCVLSRSSHFAPRFEATKHFD